MTDVRNARRAAGTVAAGVVLLLAGCADGDLPGYGSGVASSAAPSSAAPSASAASPSPSTSVPAPGADAAFTDPGDVATAEPGGAHLLTVTDVTIEEHDGFERVVLALDGDGTPGWRVGYVDAALDPGTGEAVEVVGDTVLQIDLTGTAMPMDSGVTEYGGEPVEGAGGPVEELVYRFVLEGTTTSFVGVTGAARPFRVQVQDDPLAVTVDVQR